MTPILLFDGDCHTCRKIAHWVETSARKAPAAPTILVQPIGQDPAALRLLSPDLSIWEAYAAPHVLMPDGSMKRAGYAVAEVFRLLPNTRWFSGVFGITIFGLQPFQMLLNLGYLILADIRPVLGCESCGRPSPWVKPLLWIVNHAKALLKGARHIASAPHFTTRKTAQSSRR